MQIRALTNFALTSVDGPVPRSAPLPEPDLTRLRGAFDKARMDAEVTYDELADATGLSRRTLLDIATGTSAGTLRTWALISRALDVPLDELVAPIWE